MLRLTNERQALRANRKALAKEFKNAEQLYSFALGLFNKKSIRFSALPGIDRNVLRVTMGLFTKSCRLYRCIYLQLLHGLVPEEEVSLRCLYETTLTLIFVLKPRLTLPKGNREIGPVPGKPLTTPFRARLYQAHVVFDALDKVHELLKTPGSIRFGRKFDLPRLESNARRAELDIGPEWTKRLKRRKNCFGMSIRALTVLIKQQQVYMQPYYIMSKVAHARDALNYLVPGSTPDEFLMNLEADTANVARVSGVADVLMYDCVSMMNRRYLLRREQDLKTLFTALRLKERADEMSV